MGPGDGFGFEAHKGTAELIIVIIISQAYLT